MTSAAALPLPIEIEIEDSGDVIPFNAGMPWPQNVPSIAEATRLLFEGSLAPTSLETITAAFLTRLSVDTRAMFNGPAALGMRELKAAVATAWRFDVALRLPMGGHQDEGALQNLFSQAADARAGMKEALAAEPAPALAAAMREVEPLLLQSWDKLLRRSAPVEMTPPGGYRALGGARIEEAQSRRATGKSGLHPALPEPASRRATGKSGLHPAPRMPEPTMSSMGNSPNPSSRLLTGVLMVALAAAVVGWSFGRGDGPKYANGGAPDGWVLAGDLNEGLATLMPANPSKPHSDGEVTPWLEAQKRRGFKVRGDAPHEFTLSRPNADAR